MAGAMEDARRDFWVTVEVARGRTRDVRVRARSEWSAAWLQRTLEPGFEVVMVRPAIY